MRHDRSSPKFCVYFIAVVILIAPSAYILTRDSDRDVWEAAKAAATQIIQDAERSSVHPFYPEKGQIEERDGVHIVKSWVDINGKRLEWESHVVRRGRQCEVKGVVIDPRATDETIKTFNEIARQLTSG